jgi:hypothetical protein
MNRVLSGAIVVTGLVLMLGGTASWGGPPNPTASDVNRNTAGGTNALLNNTGIDNTAFGYDALKNNASGQSNTAIGVDALLSNTEGDINTAIGFAALRSNTTGSQNTATGVGALNANTIGGNNTAAGFHALLSNTTGYNNTASGADALYSNTTGSENTATGRAALAGNTTGRSNIATGRNALGNNTSGSFNTGTGYETLVKNTSGAYNTALGYRALFNSTGSRNLALGVNAGFNLSSGDRNIYLGSTAVASESNTMRLGQGAVTVNGVTSGIVRTFIAGITGVAVSGSPVVINGNGQVGIQASSARYKRDIKEMGVHSQGLHQLRPVTFHYKQDAQGVRQYGLIAEEVEVVYPELVIKEADGKVESVQYHQLIPMLLNEVQHQQQEIVGLKAANARLQAELVRQNAAVAARLERLEAGAVRTARAVPGR